MNDLPPRPVPPGPLGPPPLRQPGSGQQPFAREPRPKKRWLSFLLGLSVLFGLAMMGIVFLIGLVFSGGPSLPSFGDKVGVVEIKGVLMEADDVRKQLWEVRDDKSVKALVVRIDSPGGAVGASQEIYEGLLRIRRHNNIPVVVSMGNLAASGGYYVACGADLIVANRGTITGSIGVIMQTPMGEKLLDKIGLEYQTVKSGKFKDVPSISRGMSETERQLLQTAIDDTYEQFLEAVMSNRRAEIKQQMAARRMDEASSAGLASAMAAMTITDEEMEHFMRQDVADGRILTGRQALAVGLVDRLGTFEDAVALAAQLGGIEGRPSIKTFKKDPTVWDVLQGETASLVQKVAPRFSVDYRLPY